VGPAAPGRGRQDPLVLMKYVFSNANDNYHGSHLIYGAPLLYLGVTIVSDFQLTTHQDPQKRVCKSITSGHDQIGKPLMQMAALPPRGSSELRNAC